MKYILWGVLIVLGIFFVIYGSYDDSPGGQLMGLIAVIVGVIAIIRLRKKHA